ncbi:MAG: acyltransferase [Faecalicatena sp.]|uniref:acyltransferase n=1 Tax=Faecalicatena sp. TaxID=2005360 RepID=UPI002585E909|nr:acyltransferase [Faecalicatena sp.]MCI6465874.1 acyltransferase [Faecalicatena sp.]
MMLLMLEHGDKLELLYNNDREEIKLGQSVAGIKPGGKKERDSNFELLRIIAMILIVMHHFSIHGGYNFDGTTITFNRIWVQILSGGGRLGVDLFILISGYFLVDSEYKPKKLIKLILQVTEYAVLCTVLLYLAGKLEITSVTDVLQAVKVAVLPIPYGEYWFATTYFLLYIFSPYLNCLIKSMEQKMHLRLIMTGIILWCLFPSILGASFSFNYLAWFMVLYFIAAYFKKYPFQCKIRKTGLWLAAIGSYLILLLLIICVDVLSIKNPLLAGILGDVKEMNRIVTLTCAVFIFLAFKTLKIQNKWINKIAGTTFGVYLFHDFPKMRSVLWMDVFHGFTYVNSPFFIAYTLFVVAAVFLIGSIIEIARLYLSRFMNKIYLNLCEKYTNNEY